MFPSTPANDSPTPAEGQSGSPIITQAQLKRERLRFTDFRFARTPAGQCTADVELEWLDGMRVAGSSSGQSSPMGDLRIAAEAALKALESFTQGAIQMELVGIKAMRAFDANIVIVSIAVKEGGETRRLLGCYLAERDPIRASVIAILNATNRLLGNFISTR